MEAQLQKLEFILLYIIDLHSPPTTVYTPNILYPWRYVPDYPTMPATSVHSSQSLKRLSPVNNISVNETTREAATAPIGTTAKPIQSVPSQSSIGKSQNIPGWYSENRIILSWINTKDKLECTTGWHGYLAG